MFQMHDMTALQVNAAYLRESISEMRGTDQPVTDRTESTSAAPQPRSSGSTVQRPISCEHGPLAQGA